MILQALKEYYNRMAAEGGLAPQGWIQGRLDFLIQLDDEGNFLGIEDLRESDGKRNISKPMEVPYIGKQALKHNNSGSDANLLWDNASFVFGLGDKGALRLKSIVRAIDDWLGECDDAGVMATRKFLARGIDSPESFAPVLKHKDYGEILLSGSPKISFRVIGTPHRMVYESLEVRAALAGATSPDKIDQNKKNLGTCLVAGEQNVPIELTHTVIKGVWGAQTSGACIVSFNKDKPAFESFGKEQSHNAPVGKKVASEYVKSLNFLLQSEQCVHIADASIVFWSEKKTSFESDFALFFDSPQDDPSSGTRDLKALFESVRSGAYCGDIGDTPFYVLGLSPNSARISVRSWKQGTVREFGNRIKAHFDDLEIELNKAEFSWDKRAKANSHFRYFGLQCMLLSIVRDYKPDLIPPNLAGAVIKSVLDGLPYPRTLLQQCIRRIRAEQSITRERAAILKACINRHFRNRQYNFSKEVQMVLDQTNKDAGYLLGRLFAVFEKTQEEVQGKGTIRERFYGAASSSPATVFPMLFKLKNHHLAKLNNPGRKVNLEKLIGSIVDGLEAKSIPPRLTLDEQAIFAIGYYHQRQDFFKKQV